MKNLVFSQASRVTITIALLVIVTGCTTLKRNPVPIESMDRAVVPGMAHVRDWADERSPEFQQDLAQSVRQETAVLPAALLLSGGGSNGAFGAGYLCGWTETGTRPSFKIVTGVSTGALASPFAFLGPDYDDALEEVFTSITTKEIYKIRSPVTVLRKDSLARTDPLALKLEKIVDSSMLTAIADEHRRGRRLFVATTNLDAQRLVVWNMGAIAASGHPGSLELFRNVLLASASIPVAFPPVYIGVEVDGRPYDEMHVDGGVIAQFFLWGALVDLSAARQELGVDPDEETQSSLYIIRNSQIEAAPELVERNLVDIASRSMMTLLKAVAMGDLIRVWTLAEQDNVDFNYVGIPPEHAEASAAEFEPAEMRRLFELGHAMATGPEPWRKEPPSFLQ